MADDTSKELSMHAGKPDNGFETGQMADPPDKMESPSQDGPITGEVERSRAAAAQLAKLGGTQPDLVAPPRRRFPS